MKASANTLALKGSHGTSAMKGFSIQESRKFCPGSGMIGKGVYFWGEEDFLKETAEAWARYRFEQGCYEEDCEMLGIFIVKILTCPERVFHIDGQVRARVAKEMMNRGLNMSRSKEDSKFFDGFIQRIEKELGQDFQVLKGEIPLAPKKYFSEGFPYNILNPSLCYAVKDTEIIEVEELQEVAL